LSEKGRFKSGGDMLITEEGGRTPKKPQKRMRINAANSASKQSGQVFDSTGKLIFPLIKGYDDYDRVLKEVLGDDS
jgi:hypothetical protein